LSIKFDVDAAFAKIGELVAEHGPEALSAAEAVKRINGIQDLTEAFVLAGVAFASFLATKFLFKKAKTTKGGYDGEAAKVGLYVTGGTTSAITLWLGAVSVQILLNPWVWTAIFYPKLALARDVWVALLN
jgi:hypothetical protein